MCIANFLIQRIFVRDRVSVFIDKVFSAVFRDDRKGYAKCKKTGG